MKPRTALIWSPESQKAAAKVVARLLARDGTIHRKELDVLESMDAFRMLGIERGALVSLAESLSSRPAQGSGDGPVFEPEFESIQSRPLQLLICALLVRIAESDGEVAAEESALVRKAFLCWNVSPEALRRESRVPLHRSLAALGMLPEAA